MKTKKTTILAVILCSAIFTTILSSCETSENKTKISSNGKDDSHNNGKNCQSCHVKGGKGDGWFTIAGSVYDSTLTNALANGYVELYSQPNGQGSLVKKIEIDKKGNFYTTESVDFGSGLYPVVTGSSGGKKHMASSISNGACNSCHNVSQSKIWTR